MHVNILVPLSSNETIEMITPSHACEYVPLASDEAHVSFMVLSSDQIAECNDNRT